MVKYHVYFSKLRMEFYFELMKLFFRMEENFIGIYCGAKSLLVARIYVFYG